MPFLDSSSSGTLEAKYLKAKDEICYVSVLENINVLMFYKLIVGVKTVKFIVIKTLFNLLFLMRSLIFSIEKVYSIMLSYRTSQFYIHGRPHKCQMIIFLTYQGTRDRSRFSIGSSCLIFMLFIKLLCVYDIKKNQLRFMRETKDLCRYNYLFVL